MKKELLVILGKKWQDLNGNTYHTSEIITKNLNHKSNITYGYGSQYIQTAIEILKNDYKKNIYDYNVISRDVRVNRKKDL